MNHLELFKDKKTGAIASDKYNKKYNESSKKVRELEEEEKKLQLVIPTSHKKSAIKGN